MFEKEAEEIANKKLCSERICYTHCNFNSPKHHRCGEWHRIYECAKESAEFGYNKANEWHEIESKVTPKREISKQYMPKNKEKVLLKYHFSGDNEIHISDGYYDAYDFEFHIANNPKFRIVCVIAWKEIELPKEIKENDKVQS